MFGEIEAALSLWDRLKGKFVTTDREGNLASRFVSLFERHDIHRNQIPRFFGYGLTVSDVSTDEKLLNVLTEEMIQGAAELFAVNREWLDGADNQIYEVHDFYKHPEDFEVFVTELCERSESVHGVLYKAKTSKHEYDSIIVIEEHIGWIEDRLICRYHLCGNWIFSYWKCRAYLTACVAIAWKNRLYIHGGTVSIEWVKALTEGIAFISDKNEKGHNTSGETWYPEDLSANPDVYLEGLSEGKSGRILALDLWLELHQKGLMDAGLPGDNFRSSFEQALDQLQS